MPSTRRIDWIDAAKGVCILAVVLYHFNQIVFQQIDFGQTAIPALWNLLVTALKPLRMPLFFLISGFLASRSVTGRGWKEVRTSRVASLLWIYVLWVGVYWLFTESVIHPLDVEVVATGAHPETLGGMAMQLISADTGLWYLYALVLYFVTCKLLQPLKQPAILSIGLGVVLHLASSLWLPPGWWNIASLLDYFFFFALGCHLQPFLARHYVQCNIRRLLVTGALTGMALGVTWKLSAMEAPGVKLILALLMVSTTIDFFALLTERFRMVLLCDIGQRTLPIYVIHKLLIFALVMVMPETLYVEGTLGNGVLAVTPLVMTVLIGALCLLAYRALNHGPGRVLFTMPDLLRRAAYRTGLLQPSA
ncbi:acyltransferase family protein [Kushneria indalinina]|uniref:Putative membrane protein YcfT n=1 Tax=Kushneria indalinina DSM 14324 TaxID=1122140 RepID=A0A3D9DVZ9_9GAMM|nr:acyltransferase family protein [Kushneria indalinina]REC94950.1 putative membrane protein YcfT [Kushneria indalinina DSM 14324]